ncbi:MAG: ribosomal protein large subunit ribosomal protein [Parcubacteria group bacterium]|nr:ribosomal protein large subunit ribosomal protein [Parcubacteria group bacterium]
MEQTVYDIKGKKSGSVTLNDNIFGLPWNADLVAQVANSLASSKRKNIAHTKSRADVRGGGKKPWQQKGTGRARHGSTRSPIWVGGGVAHGPRNDKNYDRSVSKKMKAKALYTILSRKLKDGEILFVDSLALSAPKTKVAIDALKTLSTVGGFERLFTKKNNSAVIALSGKSKETERSFKNLGNVTVIEARNLHPLALLNYKYLVLENPNISLKDLPGKMLLGDERKKSEPKIRTKRVLDRDVEPMGKQVSRRSSSTRGSKAKPALKKQRTK